MGLDHYCERLHAYLVPANPDADSSPTYDQYLEDTGQQSEAASFFRHHSDPAVVLEQINTGSVCRLSVRA